MTVTGRVARQGFGLSDCPARPATIMTIGICAPRKACAATRTATFRRVCASVRSMRAG